MENKTHLDTLKQAGYKITKPRLFVLSLLSKSANPLSAKRLTFSAKRAGIDQATVYRTLESFKKTGIINEIHLQENAAYFELKDDKKDHHHIICVSCKKIKDFKEPGHAKLITKALQNTPDFAKILNHSFELFGVCKSCKT